MAEDVKNAEEPSLASEVDAALATLDSVLAEASRSVGVIRSHVSQIAALEEKAREMEAAVSRALESLSRPLGGAPQTVTPTPLLRPVPVEAVSASSEPEAPSSEPAAAPSEPEPEPSPPDSHCLRLAVSSKAGSLDLKAVDGSVNEIPAVVDVALLDYDGRQATLKLWINRSEDPNGVREALLASLQRRLGDDQDAEVRIDFEEEPAA